MNWTTLVNLLDKHLWDRDNLTLAIAIYGAVFATVTYRAQQRDKKPNLRISIKEGVMRPSNGELVAGVEARSLESFLGLHPKILFEAANIGSQPISLKAFGVIFSNKSKIYVQRPHQFGIKFPYILPPGDRCVAKIPPQDMIDTVVNHTMEKNTRFVVFFEDNLGNIYTSRPFRFDIQFWKQKIKEMHQNTQP